MRYKIGDKVKVRSDLVVGRGYNNFVFVGAMEPWRSAEVTIKELHIGTYGRYCTIAEDDQEWGWTAEMFEPKGADQNG